MSKSDIVEQLRALARCEHSDLSVGIDAAEEIERLTGLLKASAEHAEHHSWKCGLNPNPYAIKHMVAHCTCARASYAQQGPGPCPTIGCVRMRGHAGDHLER